MRSVSNQSEGSFSEENQMEQSVFNSIDPLETLYPPSELVTPSVATPLLDSSTFWSLPILDESVDNPMRNIDWPLSPSIRESTSQSQYCLPSNLSEELSENIVSNAPGSSTSIKDLDDILQNDMIDIGARTLVGQTTLHLGAQKGHIRIVAMLLERSGNTDDTDNRGRSALHVAAAEGHLAVVQLLIEKGAEVYLKDARGQTSLHLAAENGHVQIVQFLLQQRPVKEAKDALGRTPLHIAIERGYEDIVLLLLDNGADPRARVSP